MEQQVEGVGGVASGRKKIKLRVKTYHSQNCFGREKDKQSCELHREKRNGKRKIRGDGGRIGK